MSSQQIIESNIKKFLRTDDGQYWFAIKEDVFIIPHLDNFILYAPLLGLASLLTKSGLGDLLSFKNNDLLSEAKKTNPVYEIYSEKKDVNVIFKDDIDFKPLTLTLSPSSQCQLKCSYCYISGGDTNTMMEFELSESAIQYVYTNIIEKGCKEFILNFHGEGEPTLNWTVFSKSILFVEKLCNQSHLTPKFSLVTNGILSKNQIDFLINHKVNICISFDGLTEIMNKQRALRNGKSSFEKVYKSIKQFDEYSYDYSIRSTVTSNNIDHLSEFLDFLIENTNCNYVHFEPIFIVGRASENFPKDELILEKFATKFNELRLNYLNKIQIGFSTYRFDQIKSNYCGAYGKNLNFCVSSSGNISSCYEVLSKDDARNSIFIYGYFNKKINKFQFRKKAVTYLRKLNVLKIDRCKDCFAKWNCGGGCLAKIALTGKENIKSIQTFNRCCLIRKIISQEIYLKLISNLVKEVAL